jgi:hypothetical protein
MQYLYWTGGFLVGAAFRGKRGTGDVRIRFANCSMIIAQQILGI